MNNSKMATDLLSAGIRKFEEDGNKVKLIIRKKLVTANTKSIFSLTFSIFLYNFLRPKRKKLWFLVLYHYNLSTKV